MVDDRQKRAQERMGMNHLTSDALAKIAGVYVDREGLGAEYPKMLYRSGENPNNMLNDEPTQIAGVYDVQTRIVEDDAEEAEAVAEGWVTKVSRLEPAKDDEPKRGPGRPKLSVSTD